MSSRRASTCTSFAAIRVSKEHFQDSDGKTTFPKRRAKNPMFAMA